MRSMNLNLIGEKVVNIDCARLRMSTRHCHEDCEDHLSLVTLTIEYDLEPKMNALVMSFISKFASVLGYEQHPDGTA